MAPVLRTSLLDYGRTGVMITPTGVVTRFLPVLTLAANWITWIPSSTYKVRLLDISLLPNLYQVPLAGELTLTNLLD